MARYIAFFSILLVLFSCKTESKPKIDVSEIEVEIIIERFEQEFYNSTSNDLNQLKENYAIFFPTSVPDSVWVNRMISEEEQYLFEESNRIFGDFEETENQLIQLFKHIKYYYPKFDEPKVITYISDLDYEYPVVYADSLLFISLDMYLGSDNVVYQDFPKYLSQNYTKKNVSVGVAKAIVNKLYPKQRSRQFLEKIIQEGKHLYLINQFLPNVNENLKIGYSEEKLEWSKLNEINIWKYFIEKELLYSNDIDLDARFIDVAPFSKFYQEADQDSPGQIGVWIGWNIVTSYMQNNDVNLQQLMAIDSEELFRKSKYKPRKQ